MTDQIRRTERVTRSTSVTGPALEPMVKPADIPEGLMAQARHDLTIPTLWEGDRLSYRESLETILTKYDNAGQMPVRHLRSLSNLVSYNDNFRPRQEVPAAPSAPAAILPFTPPPEGSPELAFDPCCNALQIGRGWGFATGSVLTTLRTKYPDFPAPVTGEGEHAQWCYSDIRTWGNAHKTDVETALQRSRQKVAARTQPTTAELLARIAELEDKLKGAPPA